MLDLDAIEEREKAATEKPWRLETEGVVAEAPDDCDCDYPATASCVRMVCVFNLRLYLYGWEKLANS